MFTKLTSLLLIAAFPFALLGQVAPPDLTKGETPMDQKKVKVDPLAKDINLGPTGMKGWIYHVGVDSSMSRQILVTIVEEGSPAAGIVQVSDVILGVNGKGADPTPFVSDPRVVLGKAIGDAEARKQPTLKLLIWSKGEIRVVSLELKYLDRYSATAPYNCVKSANILEQGLKVLMEKQDEGVWSTNALLLMAANYPDNPANVARQAKAREWARKLIWSQEEIDKRLNGFVSTESKVGWTRGHQLMVLAEYYLQSQDSEVFPTIEAMALEICNGFSHLGTMGHQFSNPVLNGMVSGPYNIGYGAINSAGVPSYFGLLLARKCGVKRPELAPAIARATNFYGSFVSYGSIPYGEHAPGRGSHESNGKMGLAALASSLDGSRDESTKYFTKMALASTAEREVGHCGAFFNYLWAPLGANVGGEESAASHFSRISWRLDLNRTWDGGFDYDCWYHYTTGGPTYAGRNFWASIPPLLTYAMSLKQLAITGKYLDSSVQLTPAEVVEAAFADEYEASSRKTAQLIADLGLWSPKVQSMAAKELGLRKNEHAAVVAELLAILGKDGALEQQVGACFALAEIKDGQATDVLASLLTHSNEELRWAASTAMRFMPKDKQLLHLDTMLKAIVSTQRPFDPLTDKVPLQFAHSELTYLLFYDGTAYGPRGVIAGNQLNGVDRKLLYPAIEAASKTPMGHSRGSIASTFKFLTAEDAKALSGVLIDTALVPAPADNMFKSGVRTASLSALQQHQIAEGVVVSKRLASDPNLGGRDLALDVLAKYGQASAQVMSSSEILGYLEQLKRGEPALSAKAQEVLDAIALNKSSMELIPLKSIQSVTAKKPILKQPEKSTELSVQADDLAKGDSVYTWRKVHGAGKVSFSNNGTADAKNTTVQFDGKPGKYLFEVTMSDSRQMTQSKATVGVVLQDKKGQVPANRKPVATAGTIKIPKSTTTAIALQAKDPEGYELSYAISQKPAHGKLSGVAPKLSYTPNYGYSGADRFVFEVLDSEGQTASATVTLQIDSTDTLQVAIYEPFDYSLGLLDGRSGASEFGFEGPWKANKQNATISDGSISYSGLPTKGGKYATGGGNNWGGTRTISPSALKDRGLLNDGASLWFSAAVAYGPKSSYKGDRLCFGLANNGFHEGNATTWILKDGEQLGSGVGFTLANHGAHIGGRVQASLFQDESQREGSNTMPNIHGSWDGASTLIPDKGQALVVGRFIWGMDASQPDRIEIFGPMSDLELPNKPVSVLEVKVDQSSFDTLSFDKGGDVQIDEIRFGPSYESVLAGTRPLSEVGSH